MKELISNGILHRNPLLMYAIGVCPIVAVTTNLKQAVAVSIVTAIITIVVCIAANLFLKKLPNWLRVASYFLLAVVLLYPSERLIDALLPQTTQSLGIYLPLLAVNTLYLYRSEGFARKNSFTASLVDAVFTSLGYALGACTVGILREIISHASIWDYPLSFLTPIAGFARPFGGFIVLGFVAAIFAAVSSWVYSHSYIEEQEDSSETKEDIHEGSSDITETSERSDYEMEHGEVVGNAE